MLGRCWGDWQAADGQVVAGVLAGRWREWTALPGFVCRGKLPMDRGMNAGGSGREKFSSVELGASVRNSFSGKDVGIRVCFVGGMDG